MKRFFSAVMALIVILGMTSTGFAADRDLGSLDFMPEVSGSGKVVKRTIRTRSETVTVTGYSFPAEAKEVLRIVNAERRRAGLDTLVWETELEDAAILRALEQYLQKSHTRPDGSNGLSVSSYAHGENLAGGDTSAEDVMDGWMNSPDHKDNILEPAFTSMAAACVETDQMVFWVQLFHADSSKSTSSASSSSSAAQSASSSNTTSSRELSQKTALDALNKAKSANKTTAVAFKDYDFVPQTVLKAMADWGKTNGKTVSASFATTLEKAVQGQMTINPADFASLTAGLKPGVRIDSGATESLVKSVNKWYNMKNNKFDVIKLDMTGNLGAWAAITSKTKLAGTDPAALAFYHYDRDTHQISKLDVGKAGCSIDSKNYLRFNTAKGGYIIVCQKPLTK